MITDKLVISHLYQNKEDGQWVIQTNDEHQKGVAKIAASFAEPFGLSSWGYALGILHDKGKERMAFQQYIRKANGIPTDDNRYYDEHTHAFVGGILAKELMGKVGQDLLVNQIISHHTGLHDYIDVEETLQEKQLPKEINKDNIDIDKSRMIRELEEFGKVILKGEIEHLHHLSRMLFSCLIDADRLDTEMFMSVELWKKRAYSTKVIDLIAKLEAYIQTLQLNAMDSEVNRIRRKVQEQCDKTASGEKGFYSLTVPTGGGKTLSSLSWAMKHAVSHTMSRIIIAIPYTSIIVQTASLLKEVFGEENVLEHHSNFNPDDIKDENIREKAKLATENWDYPIIVTTNVQLFESMFSNRPSDCRKLHNIVNSVIILDEVQTLPADFLQPIVDALKAYQKMFGVSILFTTASQPVLSGEIEGTNPQVKLKGIERITEIIPDEFALYDKLRRVELDIDDTSKTYEEIAAKVSEHDKVLCIVNTRKDAKELYDRLPDEGVKLHLSRMMCPAHVNETIGKIKALLQDESTPIVRVIATQLVEAGVDIDFPVVFRQESGLDSILQAAGRCNREGKNSIGRTYVFSLERPIPPGSMSEANDARKNLPKQSDWFAPSTMEEYFRRLYKRKDTFDKKKIACYLYKPRELRFATASNEFKLIDDDSISLIVNWKNSLDLVDELKDSGYTYPLMKRLAQYTVGVRRFAFKELVKAGFVEEILDGVYVLMDKARYNNATGLDISNYRAEEVLIV